MAEQVEDSAFDENELQRAKKSRKVAHSGEISLAFSQIRFVLQVFGRLPFYVVKKESGAYVYRYRAMSLSTMYFFLISIFFGLVFFMTVTGFVSMFFETSKSGLADRCHVRWETFNLRRSTVPTVLTVSWLYSTVVGSIFLILRGREYLHYMNYWNRAVQVMDVDPTEGTKVAALMSHIVYFIFVMFLLILYTTRALPLLHEAAGSIGNALVRIFVYDIGYSPSFDNMIKLNENVDCSNREAVEKEDYESKEYMLLKMFALVIQIYTLYGSRAFIIQFRFYCRMLSNVAYVWNERFKNYLHRVVEDPDDQTKRRLERKFLMKDHLIVVQMFKLTESAFSPILCSFYFVQVLNLCCQLYYLSALGQQSSCENLITGIDEEEFIIKACYNIDKDLNLSSVLQNSTWFDDPCRSTATATLHEGIVGMSLLALTAHILFATTMDGSLAYEEGMRGFSILRRHCYMYCQSRRERNFIHSLIISFAKNNPLHITAGRYFAVNRTLIIVIMGALVTWYIILLQFRPGQLDVLGTCVGTVCDNKEKVDKYNISTACSKARNDS